MMGYSILLTRCVLPACCSKSGKMFICLYFLEVTCIFCKLQFFEMKRDDAIRALDMYKRAIEQVNHDLFSSVS